MSGREHLIFKECACGSYVYIPSSHWQTTDDAFSNVDNARTATQLMGLLSLLLRFIQYWLIAGCKNFEKLFWAFYKKFLLFKYLYLLIISWELWIISHSTLKFFLHSDSHCVTWISDVITQSDIILRAHDELISAGAWKVHLARCNCELLLIFYWYTYFNESNSLFLI